MKALIDYIKESLEDFGLNSSKVSKFEIAVSAFYLAAIIYKVDSASNWSKFKAFVKKWGYGKELTDYDYSGRATKKITKEPGLVLFASKGFVPDSIEEIFEEIYNYQWYYVADMAKWSTQPDDFYICFGKGRCIDYNGKISKEKKSSWTQFKWSSKDEKWVEAGTKEIQSPDRFIWAENRKLDYFPIVLPYNSVLAAANDESFIDEFTSALDNDFNTIKDDADRYNELQDRLKAEFEKRKIYRSLWSTRGLDDQLNSLTNGHAEDIKKLINDKMGSWASTFNVPKVLQDEICDKWKDDIEDEDMLRKWMSMDGHSASSKYFAHKRYMKAKKIDVVDDAEK